MRKPPVVFGTIKEAFTLDEQSRAAPKENVNMEDWDTWLIKDAIMGFKGSKVGPRAIFNKV
ncbi:unnamed protein product [Prunus armeniaca]|uniref:Uncharacterized protein n=1 Tax=Prunus armeniaca TaxID=36596 RepID=A0A6J5X4W0_PRUAR|nr:unnamed protein product [Prunus armeniaca]CAB4307105.1 unnamed protein product [Prunus armeniaca]